jgi:hypothetical protein
MSKLYLGLVHSPVYNRQGEIITTSVTNLDIHDIARSCLTFGVTQFFVITPIASQHVLVQRILDFWDSEMAGHYNPDRQKAVQIIRLCESIEVAKEIVQNQEGTDPLVITTTAKVQAHQLHFSDFSKVYLEQKPILLLLGTGNGLDDSVHRDADFILEPIAGVSGYNHLSVRSAAAIILDRISSVEYKEEPWT